MTKRHASEVTKEKSQKNIKIKIDILRKWAKDALPWRTSLDGNFERDVNGDKIIDWFPRNHSEFCRWDGSQCSRGTQKQLPYFQTTGRDTFYKEYNAEYNLAATGLYQALKALASKMNESSSNISMIKRLNSELDYLTTVVASESTFVLEAMNRIETAELALRKEQRLRKNNEAEFKKIVVQVKQENEQLKLQISDLNKTLSTLVPLKGVKNEKQT